MNAQQAPRITTPPARFRAARRGLAAVALILLPFAVLGQSAVPAHAAPPEGPGCGSAAPRCSIGHQMTPAPLGQGAAAAHLALNRGTVVAPVAHCRYVNGRRICG
jgi:hypothetical protein